MKNKKLDDLEVYDVEPTPYEYEKPKKPPIIDAYPEKPQKKQGAFKMVFDKVKEKIKDKIKEKQEENTVKSKIEKEAKLEAMKEMKPIIKEQYKQKAMEKAKKGNVFEQIGKEFKESNLGSSEKLREMVGKSGNSKTNSEKAGVSNDRIAEMMGIKTKTTNKQIKDNIEPDTGIDIDAKLKKMLGK